MSNDPSRTNLPSAMPADKRRTRRWARGTIIASIAIVVMVVAPEVSAASGRAPLTDAQLRRVNPVVEVVQNNIDAVVSISTTRVVNTRGGGGLFGALLPDVFDIPRSYKANAVGSGSIIHEKGYVITNAHVVAQAEELFVQLADGQKLKARLLASLPDEDIAILKVESTTPLPVITLGHSSDLMVGEAVIAIGNPVGLGHTVTTGIVSAVNREMQPAENVTFKNIIQTDAAINPGNSGGPLLNIVGEQIGVNTAIRSDAQNVGFAIPVDRVKELFATMLNIEKNPRLSFGLTFDNIAPPDGGHTGVVVKSVEKGSPAEKAGLARGDIVTAIGLTTVGTVLDGLVAIQEQRPGTPFRISFIDDGRSRDAMVRIEEIPLPDGKALAWTHFGLRLRSINKAEAKRIGLVDENAIVVDAVMPGSDAQKSGVLRGDLVSRVGPYGVHTVDELGLLLERVNRGDRVAFRVVRVERMIVRSGDIMLTAR